VLTRQQKESTNKRLEHKDKREAGDYRVVSQALTNFHLDATFTLLQISEYCFPDLLQDPVPKNPYSSTLQRSHFFNIRSLERYSFFNIVAFLNLWICQLIADLHHFAGFFARAFSFLKSRSRRGVLERTRPLMLLWLEFEQGRSAHVAPRGGWVHLYITYFPRFPRG
jgi:hypothetical protein